MDFAKYAAFSVTDFLVDDDFIDGVLQPTTQAALFWSQLAEHYPALKDNLTQAAVILRSYRQQDTFSDLTLQDELWKRIEAEAGPVTAVAKPRVWRMPALLRIAAAVVPLGVGTAIFWYSQDQQVQTAYGEIKTVTLPDGTQVVLNGNSSLTYQRSWGRNTREVWLRGEGFFKVTHFNKDTAQVQPSERFVVHCRGLNVEVLGTTFDVNDRPGKVNVGLVTGKIRLTTALANQPPTALTLAPGDYVEYAVRRISTPQKLAHPERLTTWSQHQFAFTDARLGDILKTLQDAYGYQVTYKHPEAANLQIEGEINVADVAELLETVSATLHVHISQKGNHLIVN